MGDPAYGVRDCGVEVWGSRDGDVGEEVGVARGGDGRELGVGVFGEVSVYDVGGDVHVCVWGCGCYC